MPKIIMISGSPSKTSRLNGILQYIESVVKENGKDVETLHVVDLPPEDLIYTRFGSDAIVAANKKVEEADAIIVASQIYKASYTGILKTYLDLLPQDGLKEKIVLPLALGGTLAHFLTIDYSFKPVLTALGAKKVLNGLFCLDSNVQWNDQQDIDFEEKTKVRIDKALYHLIEELN
ncbi:FMN reductase [Evansella vedderi]|uniref:FMN reductase n=1 Tax=Evansella vedderi TaxID=38282 RepID=A0ABU0A0Z6_9BACI|nr:NADPH-dependent FMN reductase [Evansella vedderi]MDQ0257162.1 FMN reductase [Evansella vedderi]